MKARNLLSKVFDESTNSALETALNGWFDTAGELEYVELHFSVISGHYLVIILYVK